MLLAELKESALAYKVWDEIRDYAITLDAEFKRQHRRSIFNVVPSFGVDEGDIVLIRFPSSFRDLFKIEVSKVKGFTEQFALVPVDITFNDTQLDQYVISIKALK